jgi:hypothetical protein
MTDHTLVQPQDTVLDKDWVAFNRITGGSVLSSTSQREQISTPVTLAVTMTISLKRSSRNRSEVMAWLISIKALI